MSGKQSGKPSGALWLIMAILLSMVASDLVAQGSQVRTKFGRIRGLWSRSTRGRLAAHYLGIPYAEPPIGDLRFRNPKPWTHKWNTTYDAIKDGSMCIQLSKVDEGTMGSEDCLYLNVFVPILPVTREPKKKLPVLMYIHGGALTFGSSNSSELSPEYLMDQDVVLVTINYRLSIMGFFTTENSVAPGNYGLKDIVMALRWVQDNIEVFNGDPKSVTLWGHSGGATAVHALSLTKKTEGLFHRMILMSANMYSPWIVFPKNMMRAHSLKSAKLLGCLPYDADNSTEANPSEEDSDRTLDSIKRDEQMVDCMRTLDQKAIIKTLSAFYIWRYALYCPFIYAVEEESEQAVMVEHPHIVIRKRQFRDIPCITGFAKDEGLVNSIEMVYVKDYDKELLEKFDERLPMAIGFYDVISDYHNFATEVNDFYSVTNGTDVSFQSLTKVIGDGAVLYPIYQFLKHQSIFMKSSTFVYYFSHKPTYSNTFVSGTPIYYGVSHGDDLNYLLPYLNKMFKDYGLHNTETDVTITNIMTELWASFATTGVPKAWRVTPWPDFKVANQYLVIANGTSSNITVGENIWADRIEFWDEMYNNHTYHVEETEDPKEPSISSFIYGDLFYLTIMTIIAFV